MNRCPEDLEQGEGPKKKQKGASGQAGYSGFVIEVVIEVPLGSFIKRRDDGAIDFVSPVPCPFNYGSVPDTRSGDGDRLDAVVLGPRLGRGARVRVNVVARVGFTDAGQDDPKLICSDRPLGRLDRAKITAFFTLYARAKALLNRARGKTGPTRFDGIDVSSESTNEQAMGGRR